MSNEYTFEDQIIMFDKIEAEILGSDREAMLLHQVQVRLSRASRGGEAVQDDKGRWWVHIPQRWFEQRFSFWSPTTIQRTRKRLHEKGILLQHLERSSDAVGGLRAWYSIDAEKWYALHRERFPIKPDPNFKPIID